MAIDKGQISETIEFMFTPSNKEYWGSFGVQFYHSEGGKTVSFEQKTPDGKTYSCELPVEFLQEITDLLRERKMIDPPENASPTPRQVAPSPVFAPQYLNPNDGSSSNPTTSPTILPLPQIVSSSDDGSPLVANTVSPAPVAVGPKKHIDEETNEDGVLEPVATADISPVESFANLGVPPNSKMLDNKQGALAIPKVSQSSTEGLQSMGMTTTEEVIQRPVIRGTSEEGKMMRVTNQEKKIERKSG